MPSYKLTKITLPIPTEQRNWLKLKEYEAAIRSYTKALELNSNETAALWDLGLLYYNDLNDYVSAASNFERQTKIDPANLDAWKMLGRSYHMQNKYDKAIASFDKILEIDPTNENALYWHGESIRQKESKKS